MSTPRLSATAADLLHAVATRTLEPEQGWGWYLPDATGSVLRARRALERAGYVTAGVEPGRPLVVTAAGEARLAGGAAAE